ncbi:MAG TPA: MCD, Malonyl-CoA decarboxylase MCD, partial [Gammaproteobacteria bacterium]|nr:MCD, Malonyl-CoA decarboxylase MCD [Gammaproteobacteria bacterium]
MALQKFQDFLSLLVSRQHALFSNSEKASIEELVTKLMGTSGEVSGIVTARRVLDHYVELSQENKLAFFQDLESSFNADQALVNLAYQAYAANPCSKTLNKLSLTTEPRRLELLRRLNQTPGATHDLVSMRADLLGFLKQQPELKSVDDDFVRMFTSWFGRGFLQLETINWSTSAAILERIIRYEAVHAIRDWDDLRSRIDPPNRRCFAYFHPALVDEPLIFVEVALLNELPDAIAPILENDGREAGAKSDFNSAVFYSISNCQPGLRNISFGNFLIKQVVQELQNEFPSIKNFVTLSPVPGFSQWLASETAETEEDESSQLFQLKAAIQALNESPVPETVTEHADLVRKAVFNYLVLTKKGKFPLDPVARFHL